ncbi:ABC transporter ATP-binding protein [Tunicatimonas pelagia]|uniref:ABC transporter ATP-binding protein n=1 Tax=Tunicatimonas pelagia TaxID=931531 RepID=UPI002665D958|nr:ATP-binding cassette domain-containing protein [Tunicatimonas pelagia]WKN41520.1 ATP-binding cassette domain-containing protein [Tunicatimonas pelagia]
MALSEASYEDLISKQPSFVRIELEQVGKKFQRGQHSGNLGLGEWIFRGITLTFQQQQSYAFTGPNGSGKSTLLLILAGLLPPSKGKIHYYQKEKPVDEETIFRHISMSAPYMELIEEFTLEEFLSFHTTLKPFKPGVTANQLLERTGLTAARQKYIYQFSSGMKQRLKLGISFYSQSPVLLLDEPCSNLDQQGIQWYQEEIKQHIAEKLVIICSNQSFEYDFCDQIIDITQFKR